jgi:serine/threonine protein kinase
MSDATLSRTTLNAGDLLEGKYRIKRKLAEGGMGAVYHAVQEPLGRDVAVKVLKSVDETAAERDNRYKRFFREAAICSRLNHPNTVMIFDYGKLADGDGFFLVMEFLRGESLRDLLNRHGVLTTSMALHIAIQIAGSLADAHSGSVVHRDLKPPNIMLVDRGGDPYYVKVVDFGLVKELNNGDETGELTAENTLIGSPMYMAPERFLYHSADSAAVDIYALGIMLYEMLVGRPPFIRDSDSTIHRVMMAHIQEDPPPMRTFKPDLKLPDGLEALVMRCLIKDPARRLESMDMLVRLLRSCSQGAPIEIPPLRPSNVPQIPESTSDHLNLQQDTQNTVRIATGEEPRPDLPSLMTSIPTGTPSESAQSRTTFEIDPVVAVSTTPMSVVAPSGLTHEIPVAAGSQKKVAVFAIGAVALVLASLLAFNAMRSQATTSLVVETTPPGAHVVLDGVQIGVTPLRMDLDLGKQASLRIEKEGFETYERGLSASEEPIVIALPLTALVAEVVVKKSTVSESQREKLRAAGCLDEFQKRCADELEIGGGLACLAGRFASLDPTCQSGLRALEADGWGGLVSDTDALKLPALPAEKVEKVEKVKTKIKKPADSTDTKPAIKLGR